MNNPRARLLTLGCRLNHADTALLMRRLERAGYTLSAPDSDEPVDLIVINSCAVTAEAVRKTGQLVRRCAQLTPRPKIVVCGCAAALEPELLRRSGADETVDNDAKHSLFNPQWQASPDRLLFREYGCGIFPFRTRAFIKIQEGCNNFCTYCIVPYVRGREMSRDFDESVADCRSAVEAGFPELVLTGVNTCAYRDGERRLGDLIHAVASLPGDFRIRLSSTEPHPDNANLAEIMAAEPKVCRFLHLSLQHGCDRILQRMNRHYTAQQYREFAEHARKLLPGLHLGSDVIVGFPGETDEDFEESLELIRSLGFANIHQFTYSPRPGTPAAEFKDRPKPETVHHRFRALQQVAEESAVSFARSQLGLELPVIFETVRNGLAYGWSDNYLEVTAPADQVPLGRIVPVTAAETNLVRLAAQ